MNISKKYSFFIFLFSFVFHIFVLWALFGREPRLQQVNPRSDRVTTFLVSQTTPSAGRTETTNPEPVRLPDQSSLEGDGTKDIVAKDDAPSSEGQEVRRTYEGGVFARRLRRSSEGGDSRLRHLSASERHDLTEAQKFLLQLRHPSPEATNEVLCELCPPNVGCTDGLTLPTALADEWLAWLQKGLAPQQMLINRSLLEPASQIRRQQPL
jgi:hypothetical protein